MGSARDVVQDLGHHDLCGGDVLAYALETLQHRLRAGAVRPEVWILRALTEVAELAL